MRQSFSVCIFLFSFLAAGAQKEYKKGDRVPAALITSLLEQYGGAAMSDRKDQLLILDFWAVTCGQCIAGFPKLEALQQKFGTPLQVILINQETADSTQRFFAKRKRIKVPSLPMVSGDTVWHSYFPHIYKPHQVWIGSDGVVLHITDGYNATEENVRKVLEGQKILLANKAYEKDYAVSDVFSFAADKKWRESVAYYSLLTHVVSGVSIGNGTESTTGESLPNLIRANGNSVVQLFARAYAAGGQYNFSASNTVLLCVKDSFRYQRPVDAAQWDKWKEKYCYNYVLQVPAEHADRLYYYMQKDLQRLFGLEAVVEQRRVACLVLVRTSDQDKLASKQEKSKTNLWSRTDEPLRYMYNKPFSMLTKRIKDMVTGIALPTPFIDATGYTGVIDIELATDAFDYYDIPLLRKELQRYDLDLRVEERETVVLVIREE